MLTEKGIPMIKVGNGLKRRLEMTLITIESNGVVVNNSPLLMAKLGIVCFYLTLWQESFADSATSCISFDNYRQYVTDAWWVSDAALREHKQHQGIKSQVLVNKKPKLSDDLFPITGHALTKGDGDVLIFQRLFKGWAGISDTAYLTRITIAVPYHLKGKGSIQIKKNSDVTVFVIDGMPSFREFCMGYALKGTIEYVVYPSEKPSSDPSDDVFFSRLLHIDRGIKAQISLTASLVDSMGSLESKCGSCVFNADLVFNHGNMDLINNEIK
ncbi:hypothetical protein [Methylovulum psychrotolerans]|nr:hypothetical protein [Methylovulum psychrotolerans]